MNKVLIKTRVLKGLGKLKDGTKKIFRDERGIGTVEMILILVVLIALVLIFKEQITNLAESIFAQINKSVKEVY